MEKHLFEGNLLELDLCSVCRETAANGNHFKNGLSYCDTLEGPCSCGSWHKT